MILRPVPRRAEIPNADRHLYELSQNADPLDRMWASMLDFRNPRNAGALDHCVRKGIMVRKAAT